MLAAFCLLIVAGCESNDALLPCGDDGSGVAEAGDIVTQQDRDVCEWFAKLIEDVNVGEVRGTASAEGGLLARPGTGSITCTGCRWALTSRYRPRSTPRGQDRGVFEFEDVREEVNALRDACASWDFRSRSSSDRRTSPRTVEIPIETGTRTRRHRSPPNHGLAGLPAKTAPIPSGAMEQPA